MHKSYDQLSALEKASLLIADDVYTFPHNDPDVAIDYCGISGTITLSQYFDIVNNSAIDLYFKITTEFLSGDNSYWSDTTSTIGLVNANSRTTFCWTPKRAVPSSNLTSNLRVKVSAYKDSGYTQLFGEDYTDFSYDFFDHTTGDVIDYSDFETGMDSWSAVKPADVEFPIRETNWSYTGAWSLAMRVYKYTSATWRNDIIDSSGQAIPGTDNYYIQKTFDTSGYNKAYLIFHVTRWRRDAGTYLPNWPYPVFRIWTGTADYIIRAPLAQNTTGCYRIAVPIDISSSTTVKLTSLLCTYSNVPNFYYHCAYIDGILVVGF